MQQQQPGTAARLIVLDVKPVVRCRSHDASIAVPRRRSTVLVLIVTRL
jgi:hypothetical protein